MSRTDKETWKQALQRSIETSKKLRDERVRIYLENPNLCKQCGKVINYDKKVNSFCGSSCSAVFNNRIRVVKKRNFSKKALENITKANRKRNSVYKEKYNKNPKLCEICNKIMPYKKRSSKTCSDTCYRMIHSKITKEKECGGYRKNSGRSVGGYYKGIWCSSTYELVFLAYHLDKGHAIKRCDKVFIYFIGNGQRKYYPDFEIDDIIYEIKGRYQPIVDIKADAVKKRGLDIIVLYKNDLEFMKNYVSSKFKVPCYKISLLYDRPTLYTYVCKRCGGIFRSLQKERTFCTRICAGSYRQYVKMKGG